MTVEEFRKAYHAQPFRPFAIHLADGRRVSVPHQEFVMIAPTGRTIVVAESDGFNIIDLYLVTDLEFRRSQSEAS